MTVRLRLVIACLLAALAIGCSSRGQIASGGTRRSIPPVSDTMYDWDLPLVVGAAPMTTQCPPLPRGRRVKPPDRATLSVVECIEHYAPIAADVLRQFEREPDPAVHRACENILVRLWQRRLLSRAIKHRVVDRHVKLTLTQSMPHLPRLDLTVSTETSFSLPTVVFTVRTLYYRNRRPERGLYVSSTTAALQRPGRLTNINAGLYTPGDTYAFDIVLDEMVGNTVVWRKVLRTPWVTVS